jgi:IclR family transcriptional regulator, KDG regulon repressor
MAESEVKSARRVFEILEYFDRERRPLGLKDVPDGLGYPGSSGSALLKSLVQLGYLDYDRERRRYFPTMRIAALGGWVHDALFGDGALTGLMNQLHRATGESVILAAQSDLHAQYVHVIYWAHLKVCALKHGVAHEPRTFDAAMGMRCGVPSPKGLDF